MSASGELIRLMNYIDDISATLRRVTASVPMIEAEERKKLAEHLRTAGAGLTALLNQLEKGA